MSGSSGQKHIGRNRAPRVHIEYDTEIYGAQKKVELPFVMAVMADLKGKPQNDEEIQPIAKRDFDEVEAGTLNKFMEGTKPRATFHVDNKLGGENESLPVDLTFTSMEDFSPERIAQNVPALKKLLDDRNMLKSLLSMMDGRVGADDAIDKVLADPALMEALKEVKGEEFLGKLSDAAASRRDEKG